MISGNLSIQQQADDTPVVDPVVLARSQFFLYLKLFLLMGISWLSEYIHAESHGDHTNLENCNFYAEVQTTLTHWWTAVGNPTGGGGGILWFLGKFLWEGYLGLSVHCVTIFQTLPSPPPHPRASTVYCNRLTYSLIININQILTLNILRLCVFDFPSGFLEKNFFGISFQQKVQSIESQE